jgi:UDP-N-acetylmuramate--alanine ligase
VDNAGCVYAVGLALDIPLDVIRESLAEYRGVGRRMELKGDVGGVVVLDDYGHHPTAIARTMEAARERYPGRRLWTVYEPLTFHRTAAMLDRFADVLAGADAVAIADIWAGRDTDKTVTSSSALRDAVNLRGRAHAEATGSVEATADYLADEVTSGDVVLVMGGAGPM